MMAMVDRLEQRGFVHEETAGYQLTRPVPQLAHWSDAKLGGALSGLLLAWNRFRAGPARDLGAFGRGDAAARVARALLCSSPTSPAPL